MYARYVKICRRSRRRGQPVRALALHRRCAFACVALPVCVCRYGGMHVNEAFVTATLFSRQHAMVPMCCICCQPLHPQDQLRSLPVVGEVPSSLCRPASSACQLNPYCRACRVRWLCSLTGLIRLSHWSATAYWATFWWWGGDRVQQVSVCVLDSGWFNQQQRWR